jgi:hypothetical protein
VQDGPQVDLKEFFSRLKQAYITMQLVPCRGRITIKAYRVEEKPAKQVITEQDVIAQEKA